MESDPHTRPPIPPSVPHPPTRVMSSPFSSSLLQTSPTARVSLPLSPLSIPMSPASPSPMSPAPTHLRTTSPFLQPPSPPRFLGGQTIPCPSPPRTSDQGDLTCLNWLHQRGNLLPLPPLLKTTPLPQLEPQCPTPTRHPISSPSKPPYSFSSLIFMAIEDSLDKRLPVKGIYEWIVNSFPYYSAASGGWRNSVRHNLSLSKSFCRIHRDKSQVVGKGSLWCVSPEHRPALLEVLRKTHYYNSANVHLLNHPALLEGADYDVPVVSDTVEISDSLSQNLLLSSFSPSPSTSDTPPFSSNPAFPLTPEGDELVAMDAAEYEETADEEMEKDPLSDSGYIELHYYEYHQYQYLVLPGDTELDLETVEILQLDAEAQEAAGSLLDLAGGGL